MKGVKDQSISAHVAREAAMLDKGKREKCKWNRRGSETRGRGGGGGDNQKKEGRGKSKKQHTIDGSLRKAQGPMTEQEKVL